MEDSHILGHSSRSGAGSTIFEVDQKINILLFRQPSGRGRRPAPLAPIDPNDLNDLDAERRG